MSAFDPTPDNPLGNIPLPPGLLARLKQLAVATDADLDAAIRDVDVPPGLLLAAKEVSVTDHELDFELRAVRIPARVVSGLQNVPLQPEKEPFRVGRLALAACLLLALSGGLWVFSAHDGWQWIANLTRVSPTPDSEFASSDPSQPFDGPAPEFHIMVPPFAPNEAPQIADTPPVPADPPSKHLLDSGHLQQLQDILGADPTFDRLPDLVVVGGLPRHGITPPRSKSYDLLFATARGVNPWVNPSEDALLRTCTAPLVTSTGSYDEFRRLLANGRLPAKDQIRVEEFLAAQDIESPPQDGGPLALHVSAGPAPFSTTGAQLLQVAVQAVGARRNDPPPKHVILALDVSASMRHGGRWDLVRRAVVQWLRQLGPRDTASIIVFRGDAQTIVASASAIEADSVRQRLQEVQPTGATSLGAGLYLAYNTALKSADSQPSLRQRIVLVTDSLIDLSPEVASSVRNLIDLGRRSGISLDVLDLLAEQRSASTWRALARAGAGRLQSVHDAHDIRTALTETLVGSTGPLAGNAKLQIRWEPKAVERYRLVGHDPAVAPDWTADSQPANLRAGEVAVNLWELRLRPEGGDLIAEIEVTWTDPSSGQKRALKQSLRRGQFISASRDAGLQWAALVAETAEILRESPHTVGVNHTLEKVLSLATQVGTLAERPDFADWLATVRQALRIRGRSGG